ncbi:MAG: tetratricopeptide repeat protein [Anaerolineae bacterium]
MSRREQAIFEADQLIQQAVAAAQVGDNDEAEELLRRATELNTDNAEAWLWLARVVDDLEEKQTYFQQVLALDPYNEPARLGLERVQDKLGIAPTAEPEEEVTYCTWHPDRETRLRCNRCGRLMCTECAVRHPVGLRCKECVKETRSPIYKVAVRDYLIAGGVGLFLSTIAGLIVPVVAGIGFIGWFLAFFIGPAVGAGIADLMSRVVRKRGRGLGILAGACLVLGVMLGGVIWAQHPLGAFAFLFQLQIGTLIYLVLGIGAAVARLR